LTACCTGAQIQALEAELAAREDETAAALAQKDAEIRRLQGLPSLPMPPPPSPRRPASPRRLTSDEYSELTRLREV
jgi:hypothetical protein